jgi:hypothetical protein
MVSGSLRTRNDAPTKPAHWRYHHLAQPEMPANSGLLTHFTRFRVVNLIRSSRVDVRFCTMAIATALVASTLLLTSAPGAEHRNTEFSGFQLTSSAQAPAEAEDWDKLSPEQRMKRRWPQPVKAGFLIGLPILDYDDSTIGHVRKVVRTADGKNLLIVAYGRWLTWSKRLVAVPIETVAILGRQINALEMLPEDFDKAPTWDDSGGQEIAADTTIQIAISRR